MDSRGRLSLRFASAEETDFRIPGNHRASDDHYDDHDSEFHLSLNQTASAQLTSYATKGTRNP